MRAHSLIVLLVIAIVAQSCWAFGEWLHVHAPDSSNPTTAYLTGDTHHDDRHHDSDSQAADSEPDHHHSCFAHSPFAVPAYLVTVAVTIEAFTLPLPIPRLPDAPSEGIDRPNWRFPA